MYLKSIEIQGFKSFANKINFKFHNGITGIVGPNGSGKSNVADAVRWVLGEQRIKQLRGASMQDVIFSGTETRKPLSYAYVAITMDNSDHSLAIDYDEVTVARRLYRSGESEYLINGTPCRLKDVNELFYDTGIGKEGYSIIGQGQIDRILSGKPEERRELFDEAAGIVKFKKRKVAAVQKLENEKQNLVRVTDILGELEKQVGPLEKQAEVAKIFLKKKENLKALDVNVFLLENARLAEQLLKTSELYDNAVKELEEVTAAYEGIRDEYERIQTETEELDVKIEETRTGLSDAGLTRGKLESQIELLKEQINSAQDSRAHFTDRKQAISDKIADKEKDKAAVMAKVADIEAQIAEVNSTADAVRSELEAIQNRITELNDVIEESKNIIIRELNQRATIKSKLGRFDTMLEQANIRKAELNSRLLRAKSDEAERQETIDAYEKQFVKLSSELEAIDEKIAAGELELGQVRDELADKDKELTETQQKYHAEKSRLDALININERYEGYGNSVQRVMEQKDKERGIIGVVADIIKVDKKYETAIEVALGGNIQNVVTDNEDTAKRMIQYLKVNRLGRATFLPLTSITNPQEFKNPDALKEKGVIGMADELVTIERKYKDVAKAMLGRILVVDNVDNAVKIARKFDFGIRMVTLEGELLVPGGAISGGAFKNNSNLLGRKREMEELAATVQKLQESINGINDAIDEIKNRRNRLRITIENSKGDLQNKSIELNTVRISLEQARERLEEENTGTESLKLEQQEIEKQIADIAEGRVTADSELAASEQLEKDTQIKIDELQELLKTERMKETDFSAQVGDWDVKIGTIMQAKTYEMQNVDRIDFEISGYREELQEVLDALQDNQDSVEDKKAKIIEIQQTIAASFEAQTEAEKELKALIARRDELNAKQKTFFNRREELAETKGNLDKEVFRLNAQKEKMQESIESQINYMWDEYEITLSDAAGLRDETMTDLSSMKKEISSLKDQIRKLGDVNVNAIEEYKTVMERYTFLKTQHDDLVEAERTLEGIIAELDSAMRKQFTEKFAEISREYDKVFKELFGGGKGTLELIEEEDILEAGIRIISQPPGKKLQNMMQLSGGEKALSAIALLFAIQNLKPSPFCLLDEIEAALDDSNVGRFAKYLHKLTENTQFIVITHRRGTMEQVDRLYGITMQEKGVSTLVSVNLIDKDLDD